MISTSSLTLTMPRSMRPVATVPRPLIENTSSIAIRNGLSMSRTGSGISRVERVEQLADRLLPLRVAVERRERRDVDDLRVVAVELVLVEELADFHLDQVEHLRVFHRVALVQGDDDVVAGRPGARAARARASAASTQSSALTTRIAPSICAAPVIMFLM